MFNHQRVSTRKFRQQARRGGSKGEIDSTEDMKFLLFHESRIVPNFEMSLSEDLKKEMKCFVSISGGVVKIAIVVVMSLFLLLII